jgi:hypothetical protein
LKGVELAYLENRFHLLSGQWDLYLLATALLFFFLAYRFDNRFVLSLALSSLAEWFGLTVSHWPSHQDAAYRQYALLYCLLVGVAPQTEVAFLNYVSERRCQCSLLGYPFRGLRFTRLWPMAL